MCKAGEVWDLKQFGSINPICSIVSDDTGDFVPQFPRLQQHILGLPDVFSSVSFGEFQHYQHSRGQLVLLVYIML